MAARNRAEFAQSGGATGVADVTHAAERLSYRSWLGTWPMPYCRQMEGVNRLAWRSAPIPKSDAELVSFRLPAAMGLFSLPPGKFTLQLNHQPVLDFDVSLTDAAWQSADGRVRMNYSVRESNTEDSNGLLVIDVASNLLQGRAAAEFEVLGSASHSQRWFGIYLAPP